MAHFFHHWLCLSFVLFFLFLLMASEISSTVTPTPFKSWSIFLPFFSDIVKFISHCFLSFSWEKSTYKFHSLIQYVVKSFRNINSCAIDLKSIVFLIINDGKQFNRLLFRISNLDKSMIMRNWILARLTIVKIRTYDTFISDSILSIFSTTVTDPFRLLLLHLGFLFLFLKWIKRLFSNNWLIHFSTLKFFMLWDNRLVCYSRFFQLLRNFRLDFWDNFRH